MELELFSIKLNRLIQILNKIFYLANSYKISSVRVDEVNQLNVFVDYEYYLKEERYNDLTIIRIPNWVLNEETLSDDIWKYYIRYEKDEIERNINR